MLYICDDTLTYVLLNCRINYIQDGIHTYLPQNNAGVKCDTSTVTNIWLNIYWIPKQNKQEVNGHFNTTNVKHYFIPVVNLNCIYSSTSNFDFLKHF